MKIIVVGCGRVGAELAQSLSEDHEVTIVDEQIDSFDRLGASFRGRTVVGVCFDRDVLIRAGIESADALAAVTSSDNANALTARIARDRFNVPRVIARIYDPQRRALYDKLGLQTISSASWGATQIERLLVAQEFEPIYTLCAGDVQIVQVMVEELLNGRPVSLLAQADESVVISVTRTSQTFVPRPDTVLQIGDIVMLGVKTDAAKHLKSIVTMKREA
ncbi:MAG: NAD-binding protein [Anaerolineae bacterium]